MAEAKVETPVRCARIGVTTDATGNYVLLMLYGEGDSVIAWTSLEPGEAVTASDVLSHWAEAALSKSPLASVEAVGSA